MSQAGKKSSFLSKDSGARGDIEKRLLEGESLRDLVPLRYRKVLKKCLKSVVFVFLVWLVGAYLLYRATMRQLDPGTFNYMWGGWFLALLAGMIWATAAQLIYYYRYFYDIEERTVIIRKGIIAQSEITLPFSKITDVYVNQDILDVIFGLYDVHISTPTQSSGNFAHIDGLDKRGAALIRSIILERINQSESKPEHGRPQAG